MSYNPGVVNNRGELLAKGIGDAGDSIASGFQAYQQNRLRNQALQGDNEGMIAAFLKDPKNAQYAPEGTDKIVEKAQKGGGLSLGDNIKLNGMLNAAFKTRGVIEQREAQAAQAEYHKAEAAHAQAAAQQQAFLTMQAKEQAVRDAAMRARIEELAQWSNKKPAEGTPAPIDPTGGQSDAEQMLGGGGPEYPRAGAPLPQNPIQRLNVLAPQGPMPAARQPMQNVPSDLKLLAQASLLTDNPAVKEQILRNEAARNSAIVEARRANDDLKSEIALLKLNKTASEGDEKKATILGQEVPIIFSGGVWRDKESMTELEVATTDLVGNKITKTINPYILDRLRGTGGQNSTSTNFRPSAVINPSQAAPPQTGQPAPSKFIKGQVYVSNGVRKKWDGEKWVNP